MNNVSKALAYLLVIFLLLTGAGFMYHKQIEKATPTPTPVDNTPTPEPVDNTPVSEDYAFVVQAQAIYQSAQTQWQSDSANGQTEFTYCSVAGCASGVNGGFAGYNYYITVSNGNIIKYYVTNGVYQFRYVGDGLFIENIANPVKVSDVVESDVITIEPNM